MIEVTIELEKNPLRWPFFCLTGMISVIILFIFIFISYLYFPTYYSIFNNYVSELGNCLRNPNGAIYFNIGAILSGVFLFPFFIGIHLWYSENTWRNFFLIGSQTSGFIAAFSMIMVGFYPENQLTEHLFWSYLFFTMILVFILGTSISLYTDPKFIKKNSYTGFIIVILFSTFFYLVANSIFIGLNYLIEWLLFIFIFVYLSLIIYNMLRIKYS
ncbi:MAG: DUF998 domain-containing protein [Candidatus Helarchaeota archaeon]